MSFHPGRFLAVLLLLSAAETSAYGQASATENTAKTASFTPLVTPELNIPRVAGGIVADGDLSDALWKQAAVARNFTETFPDQGAKPPIGIKALMAYDDENLYVAYIITDDPSDIRAHFSDRDRIFQDDYVGMILDTNGDGQASYFIAANPFGLQGDTKIAPNNEDVSFDIIYSTGGRITDTGYQVEFAIPFRSLRFPNTDEQTWRLTHWITHPRESRNTYSWASMDRDNPCQSCQLGYIRGIEGVSPGRSIEILPAFTGSQSASYAGPGAGLDNGRLITEPSLNVKYGITSELTVDATINPDFSQIESDAAQIDVNSAFALSFPERRAFFQEGADLYDTQYDVVYTRSINDPTAAAKLSGRVGSWSLGYIAARDNTSPILIPLEESSRLLTGGRSTSNIVRARRSFENNSFIAGVLTDRRLDNGGSGTTFGVDGTMRFLDNYQFEWQALASRTSEANDAVLSDGLDGTFDRGAHTIALDGEDFWGNAIYASLEREARTWDFDIDFWQSTPTFRADNGFVTQNDSRRVIVNNAYTLWTAGNGFMDRITFFGGAARVWNYDGVQKDEWINGGVNAQLVRQTFVNINANTSNELYQGLLFNRLTRGNVFINSTPSSAVQLGGGVSFGRAIYRSSAPEIGRQLNASFQTTLRPTDRLVVNPSVNYSRLKNRESGDNFFEGYIFRSRLDYQFTRKLRTRIILQYNDFSESYLIDPLVTYRISPFTVFHVGSTHEVRDLRKLSIPGQLETEKGFGQTDRQIFFKLQYLFRV